jgi:site-specific recombinase XerD
LRLSEALELFLEARTAEGAKDASLVWYRKRIGRFVSWAGDVELEAVEVGTIRGFLVSLRSKTRRYVNHPSKSPIEGGLSPATIRGYGRALRQFFNFLYAEGTTEMNLMERVKLPKRGKRAPKGIVFDDLEKLLKGTDGSMYPERDRALVLFLADTGCRVGGVVNLAVGDLNLGAGWALVTEKGDKSRLVFFSAVTRQALEVWLAIRAGWDVAGDWVFLSHQGREQLTVSGVEQVLKRMKRRAGVVGPCNPHAFRHGFAKELDIGEKAH